jgi:5'-3' exonuclease
MCVLSGCDYLKSLKGIGIKRAKKVVEQAEDNNIEWILDHSSYILKMPSMHVPGNYKNEFKKALGIFQFHPVLNPVQKVVNLNHTSEPLFQEFVSQ